MEDNEGKCEMHDLCGDDLSNWMTNLPSILREKPLIHLAIPGSHDSMTASIRRTSKLSPDAEPCLKRMGFMGSLLTFFVSRWARTQQLPIAQQLHSGIRYYDFRLAPKGNAEYPFFVHGLYAASIVEPLHALRHFLDEHPREAVILDCQHFYDFSYEDHRDLIALFVSVFGARLQPFVEKMETVTLNHMAKERHQLIIIYRANQFNHSQLWVGSRFPNPWLNTDSIPILISRLTSTLRAQRRPDRGYVSQCILTPSDLFVTRYLYSTLKSKCATPLVQPMHNWLRKQRPGADGINIVIADFINLDDCQFAKEVITLNAKLIPFQPRPDTHLAPVDSKY